MKYYDKEINNNLINIICKRFNIKLYNVSNQYYRRCIPTNNVIILGEYDNEEYKLAAFFHELGCINAPKKLKNRLGTELAAWHWGIRLARKFGLDFLDDTIEWCERQLKIHKER